MAPEIQRPKPPYRQIADHYRELIRSGQLRHGDRLPGTREIMQEWEVAHATAAKALATLRDERWVRATPGVGTTVEVRDLGHSPRDRMMSIARRGHVYPAGQQSRLIVPEIVSAPDHVAAAMGIEPGAQVIRRYRVTCQGDTPVQVSTSWMSAELAEACPLLLSSKPIREGSSGYIAALTGRRGRSGTDRTGAALADRDTAAALGIDPGDPVLTGCNWLRDQEGEIIEFGEWTSRGDHYQVHEYELD